MIDDGTALMRLTGHQAPFSLTPAAHHGLLIYLAEARRELTGDPDGDETVRDLEVSIGDQLSNLEGSPVGVGQMRTTLDLVGPVVSEPGKLAPEAVGAQVPTWCRVLDGK